MAQQNRNKSNLGNQNMGTQNVGTQNQGTQNQGNQGSNNPNRTGSDRQTQHMGSGTGGDQSRKMGAGSQRDDEQLGSQDQQGRGGSSGSNR